ncbi:hypothetical protein ACMFMG_007739 [Clarireedia jacksonii]
MRINEYTAVSTSKVLLVPYEAEHVKVYHEWMGDEEIQTLTASERLSLEEEYAMQQSWRKDHDKLTFIICVPPSSSSSPTESQPPNHQSSTSQKEQKPQPQMIGDINLFLTPADEDPDEGCIGEIELMIAPMEMRGRGYGRAAVLAFMGYLERELGGIVGEYRRGSDGSKEGEEDGLEVDEDGKEAGKRENGKKMNLLQLRVKIGSKNEKSIGLFESIGFVRVGEGENYFGEVELVFEGWLGRERVEGLMGKFGLEGWKEVRWGGDFGDGES